MTLTSANKKTILITGATNGIGRAVALDLIEKGHHLIIHGRNLKKIEEVIAEAKGQCPNARIDTILADFASLQDINRMATELNARFPHLDVLINNAGVYSNKRVYSCEFFEIAFAVNYLASFSLTLQLMPLLAKSSSARIINMSSIGHRFVWVNPLDMESQYFFWGWVNYCRSKLLMIPFTFRLAELLAGTHITINALHPGIVVGTEVTNTAFVKWGVPIHKGAATVTNLVLNPDLEGMNGNYVEKYKIKTPSPMAMDKSLKSKLWSRSFKWSKLDQEQTETMLLGLSRSDH